MSRPVGCRHGVRDRGPGPTGGGGRRGRRTGPAGRGLRRRRRPAVPRDRRGPAAGRPTPCGAVSRWGPSGRWSRTRGSSSGSSWTSPTRRCRRRSTTRPPPSRPSTRSTTCSSPSAGGTWTTAGCATGTGSCDSSTAPRTGPTYVILAVSEVRQFGAGSLQVNRRLRAMLEHLLEVLPDDRRPPLREELALLGSAVRAEFPGRGGPPAGRSRGLIRGSAGRSRNRDRRRLNRGRTWKRRSNSLRKPRCSSSSWPAWSTAGLGLGVRDVVAPLRRTRLVAFAMVANFVVAPAIACGLTVAVRPGPALRDRPAPARAGAAGAPFLPKLAELARGDVAFSVGLMLLAHGRERGVHAGRPAAPDPRTVGGPVADPASAPADDAAPARRSEWLVRARSERWAARLRPLFAAVSNVSMVLAVVLLIGLNFEAMIGTFGSGAVAAAVLFVSAILSPSATWLGGPAPDTRSVLGLGTGQRNVAAALHRRDAELRRPRRRRHAPGRRPSSGWSSWCPRPAGSARGAGP